MRPKVLFGMLSGMNGVSNNADRYSYSYGKRVVAEE
jgi:hypothetical protein